MAVWWHRRRLRKAARLLKRGAIKEIDYALVAADIITRLVQGRPIAADDRLHLATFGAHGMRGYA